VAVALSTNRRKNTKYIAPFILLNFQNEIIGYYSSLVEIVIGLSNQAKCSLRGEQSTAVVDGSTRWLRGVRYSELLDYELDLVAAS
jgi:hypothetical protein